MPILKNNVQYNAMFDILYITIEDSPNSYGHEDDYGVVINYDYNTKKIVGFDIWDFKFKMEHEKQISLPIQIDLKQIYHDIVIAQ